MRLSSGVVMATQSERVRVRPRGRRGMALVMVMVVVAVGVTLAYALLANSVLQEQVGANLQQTASAECMAA